MRSAIGPRRIKAADGGYDCFSVGKAVILSLAPA